jgi:hypothetical protein
MKTRLLKKLRKQADKIFIIKEIATYNYLAGKTIKSTIYNVTYSKYKMSNQYSLILQSYLGECYLSRELTNEFTKHKFDNLEEAIVLNTKRKRSFIYNLAKEIHSKRKKVTKVKIIKT